MSFVPSAKTLSDKQSCNKASVKKVSIKEVYACPSLFNSTTQSPHPLTFQSKSYSSSFPPSPNMIKSFVIIFLCITATLALPTELNASNRQVSPGVVGICSPKFTERFILPVAKCFCNILFNDIVSVNVQERAESDCIAFFGSEEEILALENPCEKFTKPNGSLKLRKIEKRLNIIRRKCFPDDVFEVIITEN